MPSLSPSETQRDRDILIDAIKEGTDTETQTETQMQRCRDRGAHTARDETATHRNRDRDRDRPLQGRLLGRRLRALLCELQLLVHLEFGIVWGCCVSGAPSLKVRTCMRCWMSSAPLYCSSCAKYYCGPCAAKEHNSPDTRGHKVGTAVRGEVVDVQLTRALVEKTQPDSFALDLAPVAKRSFQTLNPKPLQALLTLVARV